jgi:hypothetical protein
MTTSQRRLIAPSVLALALACGGDSSGPSFMSSAPCDNGLAINSADPADAAKAMGVCDGLVSAAWVFPNGNPDTGTTNFAIGHGILSSFGAGVSTREGNALLAISTGTARAPLHPGYAAEFDKGYTTVVPAGFPNNSPSCPAVMTSGYDGIGLELVLVVPAGVRAVAFDYFFLTRDYPDWVCLPYLDQAGALITGVTGAPALSNVLLDASANPMYASPTSMQACAANADTSVVEDYICPLGTSQLAGTGFDNYGGSGWLGTSNLPVVAGDTVRIRFMIWDVEDGTVDSSLLIDGFRWVP